jgi:DNA-binding transcriptional regulator YhcF (GntR family)
VTVYEDMGVATDCVTGRAIVLAGPRRGYQATDVILPYILRNTTPEATWSFRRFAQFCDTSGVVWYLNAGGKYSWTTKQRQALERYILKTARKRERGIRQSMSSLARKLEVSPSTIKRVLGAMARRGMVSVGSTGRGRYAMSVIRIIGNSIRQPIGVKDDELISASTRYWNRYTEEEQDKLLADAYAWKVNLAYSMAEAGCSTVDEYVALYARQRA